MEVLQDQVQHLVHIQIVDHLVVLVVEVVPSDQVVVLETNLL